VRNIVIKRNNYELKKLFVDLSIVDYTIGGGVLMRRILYLFMVGSLVLLLSGCFIIREKIKEAPEEMTIPDNALVATCLKDEVTYKYIYYADGVYAFYIDDVKQSEEEVDILLEQAYLHGQSVENYLNATYGQGVCEIEDYEEE